MSYDFEDWLELSLIERETSNGRFDWVHCVRFDIAVPRIIRVLNYSKINQHGVRLNRRNVLARDHHRCQYCGKQFPAAELSLDHVVPRSQNGPLTWENIVCSCKRCNSKKGGRTPERAGMRLIAKPTRPKRSPILSSKVLEAKYIVWRHFLDQAHWNVVA